MSRGLYIALSGGLAYERQLDIIANNVANVNTVGFKEDRPVFSTAQPDFAGIGKPPPEPGSAAALLAGTYASVPESYTDFSEGRLQTTGNTLDVALKGEGFFVVGRDDQTLYTRAGAFHLGPDGKLVNVNGLPVMGEKGEITIKSPNIRIDEQGYISVDDEIVDRLQVVRVKKLSAMEKVGTTLFAVDDSYVERMDDAKVVQGSVEQSNANPLRGMVELITAQRNYESFNRVAQSVDGLDKQATTRIKI